MWEEKNVHAYTVYGIGNALVDMEFNVSDHFLERHGISKGHMTLISDQQQQHLLDSLTTRPRRACGGSAANTVIAASLFGAASFYSCRVADDAIGRFFLTDMESSGVVANISPDSPLRQGTTGICIVLVTPDAERTMSTHLGISESLGPEDVVEEAIRAARYVYIEGYLAASPSATKAAVQVREIAESSNVKTFLTLSDHSMVKYCRPQMEAMIGRGVDHLFCNKEEALDWAGTASLETAQRKLLELCKTCSITLGSEGSLVFDSRKWHRIAAVPCDPVDTIGAGDLYAGALIYGLARGWEITKAAQLASRATARLIVQFGARLHPWQYQDLLQEDDA